MLQPQLIKERMLLEHNKISPDDCRRALEALHAVEVVPVSNHILDYLTTSDKVWLFLEREREIIQNLLGKSIFKVRVVVGGFGAGKTHIKTYLSSWLNSLGDDVITVSFRMQGEYSGFNFYEEALLFNNDNKQQYAKIYSKIHKRLYRKAKDALNIDILNMLKDILSEGKVANKKIKKELILKGIPEDLATEICAYFTNTRSDSLNNSDRIKDNIVKLSNKDGLLTFNSVLEVLNETDFKGLCIFVDDFQNLETPSWNEHRDAFSTQLAQLHEALSELFNRKEGISVYLMILVQGRFWEGGSEDSPGLKHLANSEKLMQHWQSSVFELAEFSTDNDILNLTRKILALYEFADIPLTNEIISKLENPQEIRSVLDEQPLVPRKIIQTVLDVVDQSINTPWS